jgi:phosphate/sulfate permease
MTLTLITGIIGIGMLATFLGIMLWWIKALPLIIIVAVVMAMLLYDFVQTLRSSEADTGR